MEIKSAVQAVEPGFEVPAVESGQIAKFVEVVKDLKLEARFRAYDPVADGDSYPVFVERVTQEAYKQANPEATDKFWVPAVGNGQIGKFVQLCNEKNLWGQF